MGNLTSRFDSLHWNNNYLNFYEDACRLDSDVRSFDDGLKVLTGKVLNTLANGVDEHGLSLDSFKEVTTALLGMDHEVVRTILEYKEDAWNNPYIFQLVKEFFDNSLATLDFCGVMDKSIKAARDNQLFLQMVLNQLPATVDLNESDCEKVLKELNVPLNTENPFGKEFVEKFNEVWERHVTMLDRLLDQKRKLDRKLRAVRVWGKVSTIMVGATVAVVLICSVVAAAVAAPHIAGALAAAAALPLGGMGKWLNSLWSGREKELNAQMAVLHDMHVGMFVAIKDLDTIRALVDSLETQIISIVKSIKFSNEGKQDPVSLQLIVDSIAKKREVFVEQLDKMEEHMEGFAKHIRQARAIVLQRIIKRPGKKERLGKKISCLP